MDFERFESNRSKYGQCSSWAVWNQGACEYLRFEPDAEAAPGFFLNTSVRKLNAICSQRDLDGLGWRLNPNVVLVALNFAERDERTKAATAGIHYHAFHEETSLTSDQRLRDACCGTGLWGGYLTDLVKFDGDELTPFRSSKADPIIRRLRDPAFRQMQVSGLIKELEALGSRSPVVVALGNEVFSALNQTSSKQAISETLGGDTKILKVTHYSKAAGIRHSDYVAVVRKQIRDHLD